MVTYSQIQTLNTSNLLQVKVQSGCGKLLTGKTVH